ncbi:FucA [Tritrichomonas foetus]|uniref:alpha-L-fucosidase n=1 Tax=Tritrichomonas foetus TaxID=1144522 RepID=A0A1J4L609_9EUKA|nr:FucA [Tritrichomonas foetus]|eukprot:OHT17381.1 FucA [Tritrichomonas foetus]
MIFSLALIQLAFSVDPPSKWGPSPNPSQYRYHSEELSAFIHFGINTFTGSEWGDSSENPNYFKPTNLNTDQWVSVLKRAGFKRIIMVGRHHDGFCNWKTKYTNHSVNLSVDFQAISQFLHQSGDVLEELSKSCTKFNVDMGLYLSPWDVNSSVYGDEILYNEYYMNQLDEIIHSDNNRYGNNGKFVEIWLDGAKGEGSKAQIYWFSKWFDLIKSRQPGCVVFSGYGSEVRWIGNENGQAGEPCWNKIDVENQRKCSDQLPGCDKSLEDDNHGLPNGPDYSVGECDVSVTEGWFWKEGKVPKTMLELSSIYFTSVARGQPLLLNVPPNTEGKIPDDIAETVLAFGRDIYESFGIDLARQKGVMVIASSTRGENDKRFSPENVIDGSNETYWTMDDGVTEGTITIDFGRFRTFDMVSIREHIALGQRVAKFYIEYHTERGWHSFDRGTTIGYHRICRNIPVTANMIMLHITESQAVPLISNIEVYLSTGSLSISNSLPDGLNEIPASEMSKSGFWHSSSDGVTCEKIGGYVESTFFGTRCIVIGAVDLEYGQMDVYIDGQKVSTVDCSATKRKIHSVLYQYDGELSEGEHNLKVVVAQNKGIQIHSFSYISNNKHGMFEFSQREYVVNTGDIAEILIKRVGGSNGQATVVFQTARGSAAEGRSFEPVSSTLVFADGETTKIVNIQTKISEEDRGIGDLEFFVKIVDGDDKNGAVVGYNASSIVVMKDINSLKKNSISQKLQKKKILIYSLIGCATLTAAVVVVALIILFMIKKNVKDEEPLCHEETNIYTS